MSRRKRQKICRLPTHATQLAYSDLSDSSMADVDSPPPVPPKDLRYRLKMESALASGPKRKRESHEDTDHVTDDQQFQADHTDGHTPKRSRSDVAQNGDDVSDDARLRSVRRKKGVRNLSNLNLRHAAKQQSPRGSKFQEGSLTDKPSVSPPSMFTRFGRTDNGNLHNIDSLMAEYHDHSTSAMSEQESSSRNAIAPNANVSQKQEPRSFLRFGRTMAKFYPFGLWNRCVDETHDKLLTEAKAEAERKAKIKAEAEAKYAAMKRAGQFDPVLISTIRTSVESSTSRDSVMGLDSERSSREHKRNFSSGSELAGSQDYITDLDEGVASATERKVLRGSTSRFSLRRPSLSNIKNGLKRVASDLNLANRVHGDSSSSVSPEKIDVPRLELKTFRSRYDLKDTNRLSKRVSDLEQKLAIARAELGQALEDASPMVKPGGRHRSFTPSTLRRTKWVPGGLPTLPSERLLFPDGIDADEIEMDDARVSREPDIAQTGNTAINDNVGSTDISHEKSATAHASTLVESDADEHEQHEDIPLPSIEITQASNSDYDPPAELDQTSQHQNARDPVSLLDAANDAIAATAASGDYADLDAKLRALDSAPAAETGSKPAKSKKRKSGASADNGSYKPDAEDDDSDWAENSHTPKKKHRSSSRAEPNMRGRNTLTATKKRLPKPPTDRKSKTSNFPLSEAKIDSPFGRVENDQSGSNDDTLHSHEHRDVATNNILPAGIADHEEHQLEPVYEEEEETTTIPIKDEPSKPTAKATPARYGRPRSRSPNKHLKTAKAGLQTTLRAGQAARGRRGRSSSPPRTPGMNNAYASQDSFTAVPGQDGIPSLPKGANGSFESLNEVEVSTPTIEVSEPKKLTVKESAKAGEEFEWPEDVF